MVGLGPFTSISGSACGFPFSPTPHTRCVTPSFSFPPFSLMKQSHTVCISLTTAFPLSLLPTFQNSSPFGKKTGRPPRDKRTLCPLLFFFASLRKGKAEKTPLLFPLPSFLKDLQVWLLPSLGSAGHEGALFPFPYQSGAAFL